MNYIKDNLMLLGTIAFLALVLGVGIWQRHEGRTLERALWLNIQNKELADAVKQVDELQKSARARESQYAKDSNTASTTHQKELSNVENDKTNFINGVRSGTIKLRIPTSSVQPNGSKTSAANTSASRCDEKTDTELPNETSEFLYSEAARADEIVSQLTACQYILESERKPLDVVELNLDGKK